MKKVLLLLVIVFAVFIAWNRQRLFLRDPLASVARNGLKESGAQVFINYSNDVFIENDNAPGYMLIVQHGQHIGTPGQVKCVHWMACLMDADVVTLVDPMRTKVGEMSGRLVSFRDDKGQDVRVTLR